MFKVGDKVRIRSIPGIISKKQMSHMLTLSDSELWEYACGKNIYMRGNRYDWIHFSRLRTWIHEVHTISEIYFAGEKQYISIDDEDHYEFYEDDLERVVCEKSSQRIPIQEFRKILNV